MRIVEQSRERLVIEDRKAAPMWQPAFVVLVLTVPLLFVYVNAISQRGAWKVLALVLVIWAITAAIYACVMRFSAKPRIELDAKTGRAKIGQSEYALSEIGSVIETPVSNLAGLTITLRGRQRAFEFDSDDTETQIFSAERSTPAERSRTAKIINAFLDTNRHAEPRENPFREAGREYYVDPYAASDDDEEEDSIEEDEESGELNDPTRWTRVWDAESTSNRRCFFCEKENGDSGPLQLWATREADHQLELIFVPRCRRCRRIHNWNRRYLPAIALLAGVVAGLALAIAAGFGFLAAIGTPIAAFVLARLVTWPSLFGSTDRDRWKRVPDFQRARQDGWKLRVRRERP